MDTLVEPLDIFINQQLSTGKVNSESEAEQLILSAIGQRSLDRKLARAEQQVENGHYSEINDQFIDNFTARAKKRNNL